MAAPSATECPSIAWPEDGASPHASPPPSLLAPAQPAALRSLELLTGRRALVHSSGLGRLLCFFGDIFSLYCVVKVGLAIRSLLQHGARRPGIDPVTRFIDYALRLSLLEPAAAAFYSQVGVAPLTADCRESRSLLSI